MKELCYADYALYKPKTNIEVKPQAEEANHGN